MMSLSLHFIYFCIFFYLNKKGRDSNNNNNNSSLSFLRVRVVNRQIINIRHPFSFSRELSAGRL